MSTVVSHPSRDALTNYSAGRLSEVETADIELHLSVCEDCGEFLGSLPPCRAETLLKTVVASRYGGRSQNLPAIPGYDVLRELGHGGMGAVYLARHQITKQEVAIKMLHADLAADPAIRDRFYQAEVYTLAHLDHPNIVRVTDARDAGGTTYAVMEFVEGKTLAQMVKDDGPLPVETVCAFGTKVAGALQYLHEQKVAHRDIKPANIMVTAEGEVKILDLGLARVTGRPMRPGRAVPDGDLTQQGAILGTLRFMAPEQAASSRVDSRADIYSLAHTLYYLLTGQVPFPELDGMDLIRAHREQEPVPVAKLRAGVPSWLLKVLKKMMAKKPGDRYQTPAQVAAELTRTGGGCVLPYWRVAVAAVLALVALGALAAVFQVWPFERVRGPNEVLTTEAFEAYERGDYQNAKKTAEECIRDFHGEAERRQKAFADQRVPEPPVGKVSRSLLERIRGEGPSEVLREGALNDTATCYWLSGRCAEKLGQVTEAREAYEKGQVLTYARCWDPRTKILWPPALKCADDLENLNEARR